MGTQTKTTSKIKIMEIKEIGKTTFMISEKTVISFGNTQKEEDVIKVVICSEMNFSIYKLADFLENKKVGRCISVSNRLGFVLLLKMPDFDKKLLTDKCVEFVKFIENV